jgi:hypothetical protein
VFRFFLFGGGGHVWEGGHWSTEHCQVALHSIGICLYFSVNGCTASDGSHKH